MRKEQPVVSKSVSSDSKNLIDVPSFEVAKRHIKEDTASSESAKKAKGQSVGKGTAVFVVDDSSTEDEGDIEPVEKPVNEQTRSASSITAQPSKSALQDPQLDLAIIDKGALIKALALPIAELPRYSFGLVSTNSNQVSSSPMHLEALTMAALNLPRFQLLIGDVNA